MNVLVPKKWSADVRKVIRPPNSKKVEFFFFLIRSHSLELIIVCGFFPPIAVDFNWIQLKQDKIY